MAEAQPVQGRLATGCTHPGPHTGVLFVHGIGQQAPGETLREWGSSIVRAISDVRFERGMQADPVVSARLHPEGDLGLYLELEALGAPSADDCVGPQLPAHWVLSEAWWADRVTAPSFSVMASWLGPGGVLARIGETVLRYSAGAGPSARIVTFLRLIGLRVFLVAVASLVLFLYGLLRLITGVIPVGPLRNGLLTRAIDNFVLEWFGDVYVLIADRAQGAEIRRRFEAAAWALQAAGCERIVVVAHSGGAIVSLMSMGGEPPDLPRIDRFVTLGEGLNLAWRILEDDPDAPTRYRRLYRRPWAAFGGLIWNDFWATQDPAPSGPLVLPPSMPGSEHPYATTVWNRASIRSDHGSYWQNDEEFVIPLIRLIDGRKPRGSDSQFHRGRRWRLGSIVARRDRVGLLALARQIAISVPLVALILALVADNGASLRALGAAAASWFGTIPVLDAFARAVGAVRGSLAPAVTSPVGESATGLGVLALGVVLAGATLVVSMAAGHQPHAGPRRRAVAVTVAVAKLLLAAGGVSAVGLLGWAAVRGLVEPAAAPWTVPEVAWGFAAGTGALVLVGLALLAVGRVATAPATRVVATAEGLFNRVWRRILQIGAPVRRTMFWRVFRNVVLLIIGVAVVLAPLAALVLRADVGELVVGGGLVLAAAALVGQVAAWRWNAWDERERVEARREHGRTLGRWHVLWQAVLMIGALLAVTIGLAFGMPELLLVTLVLGLAIILVGVAIDVVSAEDSSGVRPLTAP